MMDVVRIVFGCMRLRIAMAGVGLLLCVAPPLRADEPYARSRDYDLQHSKVALRFDLEQKKVVGDVTHTVSPLRDALDKISFDSVGLQIQSVKINKADAPFHTTDTKLFVDLA